jgi:tetratricopeptide (TPR) repeat protein
LTRAIVHFVRGELEESVADFDAAVELAENYAWVRNMRQLVNHRLGRYEEAFADTYALDRLTPDSPTGYSERAFLHFDFGRLDETLLELERAFEVAENKAGPLMSRAAVLAQSPENCDRVTEIFRQATELSPGDDSLLGEIAFRHLLDFIDTCPDLYDPQTSLESARRVIDLNPSSELNLFLLGLALYRNGRPAEAGSQGRGARTVRCRRGVDRTHRHRQPGLDPPASRSRNADGPSAASSMIGCSLDLPRCSGANGRPFGISSNHARATTDVVS